METNRLKKSKTSVLDELCTVANWYGGRKLLIGFANSTFQTYGLLGGESNWTAAARKGTVPEHDSSINHWDHFEHDLERMAAMGVNSYRFSIEWSDIEPKQGQIDENVLKRYAQLFATCHKHHIEPMLTLYHFTEPLWFTKLGSFEKEENIQYFVNFCKLIFSRFHSQIKLWLTFNEPALQAFSSYFYGQFPPHQHNLKKTIVFLRHLLEAHVATYKALKSLPGGESAQIGLVHNALRFLPRYWWEPLERIIASVCSYITHDLVLSFLKSGHYHYHHFFVNEDYYDASAPFSYDFIGLNFYGNAVIGFNKQNFFGPTQFPHQEMSDMFLPIDPEGFVIAIDDMASLKKPIYVTEIGLADERDVLRAKFLNLYFDIIKIKIEDGVDIRGCYIWTFADNYEWNMGYSKKFGLHDHERRERRSAQEFKTFIKRRARRKQV